MVSSTPGIHRHSGKPGISLVLLPLGALVATVFLSVAYAYVDVYSPVLGYISLLFVALFGFGLAWSISWIGFLAKCRNTVLLRTAGLFSGLLALYVSWATFEYALFSRYDEEFTATLADVLGSPVTVWELARAINETGWYSIGSYTPTGTVLWLLWGIEAIFVVCMPLLLATMGIEDQVFCENCGEWCRNETHAIRLALPESESHLATLRPEFLTPLISLPPVSTSVNPHIRIDTWECVYCRNTAALQAKISAQVSDEEEETEEETEDLTSIWTVSPGVLKQIQGLDRGGGRRSSGGVT